MSQKTLEEKFNELCKIIQSLPPDGPFQLGNDDKLVFYGLYKQATEGDIKTEQPYFFQVVERAKWDAWNKNKGLNKEECMKNYLENMKRIMETAPYDNEIAQNINLLVQ